MYLTILLICTHPHTLTTVSCGSHNDMTIWTQVAALAVPLLHASQAMLSTTALLQHCTLAVRAQSVSTLLSTQHQAFKTKHGAPSDNSWKSDKSCFQASKAWEQKCMPCMHMQVVVTHIPGCRLRSNSKEGPGTAELQGLSKPSCLPFGPLPLPPR